MDRRTTNKAPNQSIAMVTEQMATLGPFNSASSHRKQAFGSTGNHHSWPTPPTELDHDFSQSSAEAQSSMDMDKSMITLPSLRESSESSMQSPPASPVQEKWANTLPPIHSPPESPVTRTMLPSLKDDPLFSEASHDRQAPLFASDAAVSDERADSLSPCNKSAPPSIPAPSTIESTAPLYQVFPQFKNGEREFFRNYRNERYKELRLIPGWRAASVQPTQPSHFPPVAVTQTRHPAASPVDKSRRAIRTTALPRNNTHSHAKSNKVAKNISASTVARQPSAPLKTRDRDSKSVDPPRKRAAPTKPVVPDNWRELVDFSPPTSSLDNPSVRLAVHWKGNANDLSGDPEVKHLHPQEVTIAEQLKLPAGQYLANKLRIFEARVKALRDHKHFTKTAAQQACNIDVNKTSQLFEAFQKVGWFDDSNFKRYL